MAELFGLNDTQWAAIERLLPDLGGKPRVDDRRVQSVILHRFREGLRRRPRPTPMALKPRFSTGSIAGASGGCGRRSSRPWSHAPIRRGSRWWTARRVRAHRSAAGGNVWPAPSASGFVGPI